MGPGKKTSQKPNWSTGQVSKSMEIFIDAVDNKVNVRVITYSIFGSHQSIICSLAWSKLQACCFHKILPCCCCCWSNVMLLYNCRDQTQYNVPALASSVWSGKIDPSQWCIIRWTCSHPELTKDHVLTSAYVLIF